MIFPTEFEEPAGTADEPAPVEPDYGEDVLGLPVKRGRGRPRKVWPISDDRSVNEVQLSDVDSVDADEVNEENVEEVADEVAVPSAPAQSEALTVRMFRTGRVSPQPEYTMVHPAMVDDYIRAGWMRLMF